MSLSIADLRPAPPCPAPFNMAAHVLRHAEDLPEKTALEVVSLSGAERWSYARLARAVYGTAAGLRAAGLSEGDRVMLRLGNTSDYPIAYLGAIAAGLVAVPTAAGLTAPEVNKLAALLRPAAVLTAPGIAAPDGIFAIPQDALHAMQDAAPMAPVPGDPNRPAYIVFTSGSTGAPRGVVHAHRAVWARQMMVAGWYDLRAEDRLLHAGAFNWTFTMGTGLMDPWAAGATALVPADGTPPEALPLLLQRYAATLFAAAPGIYRKLLQHPERLRLPRLRHGLVAGEKLSEPLRSAWHEATDTALHEAYGMSEVSTFISSSPARPAPRGTLGYPQPGRCIAILGRDGTPVPRGEAGAIAVARDDPGLMLGTLTGAGDLEPLPDEDWFVTQDHGIMDHSSSISFTGRDADMMNAGGFRVSPLEVEAALHDAPDIGEVAVTEIEIKPDTYVIACFHTGPATQGALEGWASARLARYKQPRLYRRLDTLPRNANGKLARGALPELYKESL